MDLLASASPSVRGRIFFLVTGKGAQFHPGSLEENLIFTSKVLTSCDRCDTYQVKEGKNEKEKLEKRQHAFEVAMFLLIQGQGSSAFLINDRDHRCNLQQTLDTFFLLVTAVTVTEGSGEKDFLMSHSWWLRDTCMTTHVTTVLMRLT